MHAWWSRTENTHRKSLRHPGRSAWLKDDDEDDEKATPDEFFGSPKTICGEKEYKLISWHQDLSLDSLFQHEKIFSYLWPSPAVDPVNLAVLWSGFTSEFGTNSLLILDAFDGGSRYKIGDPILISWSHFVVQQQQPVLTTAGGRSHDPEIRMKDHLTSRGPEHADQRGPIASIAMN